MSEMRLRFPPSPTGKIHIGNMRTALFNWLWAKKNNGKLILRIEDTDQKRSTKEFEDIIIKELDWLGIDIDEGASVGGEYGPYRQSERLVLYQKYAEKLLKKGKAYRCYCSEEELEQMRKDALARGDMPKYNGHCRNLSREEELKYIEEGREPVIRYRLTEEDKDIVVNDEIRGDVTFNTSVLDDFIIFKSDGMPTYNFAVVIDDALMKITEVIRGEDHLSNTPKQILIYEALDFPVPKFAHLPLILDSDRAKLKKRSEDDDVYIGEYREKGYLPEALFNFLVFLGWSPPDDKEILTRDEIIKNFELNDINKSAAVFDIDKLNWVNGKYIREADLDYLSQIPEEAELFFKKLEFEDKKKAVKEFQEEGVELVFTNLKKKLIDLDEFKPEKISTVFSELIKELPVGGRTVYHPTRLALTGMDSGPEMKNVIYILGIEETINRLDKALMMRDKK